MKSQFTQTTACVAALLLSAASLSADQAVTSAKFNMPARVSSDLTFTDCDNSPGPTITLSGNINLGGLSADVILQNNEKGTHRAVVTFKTNAVLVVAGGDIELPKQPVQGGTGGNPHIWLQFLDQNNNSLSKQVYLGRCVQGLSHVDQALLAEALAALDISVIGCQNHPGPTIYLSGGLGLTGGLKARFIFQNADNPVGGPHKATVVRDVSLIDAGTVIEIPKQPVLGGAGGNPIISIQFKQGNGDPIGKPIVLGKCVQI
jgi:hypothetical protein